MGENVSKIGEIFSKPRKNVGNDEQILSCSADFFEIFLNNPSLTHFSSNGSKHLPTHPFRMTVAYVGWLAASMPTNP
jgi:hypothetical protein